MKLGLSRLGKTKWWLVVKEGQECRANATFGPTASVATEGQDSNSPAPLSNLYSFSANETSPIDAKGANGEGQMTTVLRLVSA